MSAAEDLAWARFSARSILAVAWSAPVDLENVGAWRALDPQGDPERWPESIIYPPRDAQVILLPGGLARRADNEEWAAFVDEWRGCVAGIRALVLEPTEDLLNDACDPYVYDVGEAGYDPFAAVVDCAGVAAISARGDWTC